MSEISSFFSEDSLTVLASANALVLAITQGVRILFLTGPRSTLYCCFVLSMLAVLATTAWSGTIITDILVMLGNSFLLFLSVIGSAQLLASPGTQPINNNGKYKGMKEFKNKMMQPLL